MCYFQNVPSTSGQIIQMEKIEFNDQSINHCEGGWPKDISYTDSDQTSRHRKKLEKAPLYSKSIKYMVSIYYTSLLIDRRPNCYLGRWVKSWRLVFFRTPHSTSTRSISLKMMNIPTVRSQEVKQPVFSETLAVTITGTL